MLNVRDLEARHRKYKLKSYLPYFLILILFIVSALAVTLVNYNSISTINLQKKESADTTIIENSSLAVQNNIIKEQTEINQTKISLQKIASETKVIDELKVEEKEKEEQIVEEKVLLTPSLDFIRKIQGETPVYYNNEDNLQAKKIKKPKKIIEEKRTVINTPDIIIQKKKEPALTIEKKSTINIKRKDSDADSEIQHVIKRFKVNHNPALSLFVAKKYYQLGEYEKAYNYALITNDINNNIEASWIIFAKSLIKLNKKDMAVKTLSEYINHSHSSEAKILLDEIQSGKFK
ncbi:MAG: CDC27 family protein [Sulfurimonas sp.]|uniref:CDC27 family protein n=1 Tax=Sulfurimonas sp. TaxID=2022749 RepID=UPI002607798B|nr:CDC27 family protein [Sulfurimonas sp.]MCW8894258.1 CDC27 family protein [Sulfurimonas sp.]MCW8954001.1 CDC27 family protein [Sulfurimonas sp.]MCW9067055.1 CDC27 family protein [Sulfurimonas sp.]